MGGGGLWKERGVLNLSLAILKGGGGIKSFHPWGGGEGSYPVSRGRAQKVLPFLEGEGEKGFVQGFSSPSSP